MGNEFMNLSINANGFQMYRIQRQGTKQSRQINREKAHFCGKSGTDNKKSDRTAKKDGTEKCLKTGERCVG